MTNNCISCGCEIPEGMQVCKACKGRNTGAKSAWISVKERYPAEWVSVLVYMPDQAPMPTVREAYLSPIGFMVPALMEHIPGVTHWAEMPEPPKEVDDGLH